MNERKLIVRERANAFDTHFDFRWQIESHRARGEYDKSLPIHSPTISPLFALLCFPLHTHTLDFRFSTIRYTAYIHSTHFVSMLLLVNARVCVFVSFIHLFCSIYLTLKCFSSTSIEWCTYPSSLDVSHKCHLDDSPLFFFLPLFFIVIWLFVFILLNVILFHHCIWIQDRKAVM